MGTKRPITYVNNEREKKLAVPPGFVSLTSLTFKKIAYNNNREASAFMAVGKEFESESRDSPLCKCFLEKFKLSFDQKPWILHDQFNMAPHICDSEQSKIGMECQLRISLPKGVIRGCANCPDCLKVSARWRPGESCLPVLDDAPVFHPSEEEFKDTLKYITKIRPKAVKYGICRIVPPPSWKPSCPLRDTEAWETSTFSTCVQQIHGLKSLYLKGKVSRSNEILEKKRPNVYANNCQKSYNKSAAVPPEANSGMDFDFEYGRVNTLQSFKKYADSFKRQYFGMDDDISDPEVKLISSQTQEGPLIARIEGEYWRIIENPSEEIEVSCGSNLDIKTFGSGFPTKVCQENLAGYTEYMDLGWNLNNTPKLSGSLLPFGCDSTSTVLAPQLFIGMCFASQCWRIEDHNLYSLCYMHFGDPKVWYGVPGRYCSKFVEVVKKLFPQLSKYPALLFDLVFQISPSVLISEGIPVYRCVQNPLDFILIFPGVYHSGFDCGFNCSEAARFAPLDWLPHGLSAAELYSDICRRNTLFYDRLLFGAATEAMRATWQTFTTRTKTLNSKLWKIACGEEGILTKMIKSRVRVEEMRREHLCNLSRSRVLNEVEAATVRECSICLCDLYLSAVVCICSPKLYTCLRHVQQVCLCPLSNKYFIFRYESKDLNSLVLALEGNLKTNQIWVTKLSQPNFDSSMMKDSMQKLIPVDKSLPAAAEEVNKTTGEKRLLLPSVSSGPASVQHSISSSQMRPSGGGDTVVRPPSTGNDVIVLSDTDDES